MTTPTLRGTAQPFKDASGRKYWRARATLADGHRVWLEPRFYGKHGKDRAREKADEETRKAYAKNLTLADFAPKGPNGAGETCCDDWHADYLKDCKAKGQSDTKSKAGRWRKWISPHIGHKAPTDLTRDHVEAVRDAIDGTIRAYREQGKGGGRLAPKTGANVWGELTVSLREMYSSKNRALRVLDVDLTAGVQPPDTSGGEKLKCYPYPSEAVLVFSCEKILLAWRETHVVAAFTYARPGELRVLEWTDVSIDDQRIRITKAWDYDAKRVKRVKTNENREIPIHPNLLPLLRIMKKRTKGAGLVLPLLSQVDDEQGLADTMRQHFELAGCSEERVQRFNLDTVTELPLRFRSWRDAGCTWALVEEPNAVVKVQRRAGHKLISTTMRYVVEAENRTHNFGTPFPPLPLSLLRASSAYVLPKDDGGNLQPTGTDEDSGCERRELKTEPPSASADCSGDSFAESAPPVKTGDDNPAMPGGLGTGLGTAIPADEATLEAKMIAADLGGRETLARAYERQLERLRAMKAAGNVASLDERRKRGA